MYVENPVRISIGTSKLNLCLFTGPHQEKYIKAVTISNPHTVRNTAWIHDLLPADVNLNWECYYLNKSTLPHKYK